MNDLLYFIGGKRLFGVRRPVWVPRRAVSRRLPPPFAPGQSGQVYRKQRQGARRGRLSRREKVSGRRREGPEGPALAHSPEGHAGTAECTGICGVPSELRGAQQSAHTGAVCSRFSAPRGLWGVRSLSQGSLAQTA